LKHKRHRKEVFNHHHIIPRSRLRRKEFVLAGKTVEVQIDWHNWLHYNFGNLTPMEIFDFLNHKFWGDNFEINLKEGKK